MKIGKITKEIRPILSKLGDYFRNKAHFQQIFLNCEKIMGKSNVNINQTKTIAWCIFSNLFEEWLPVAPSRSAAASRTGLSPAGAENGERSTDCWTD